MCKEFIVDRIEDKRIIIEDSNGEIHEIEKNSIDSSVKEGDCLVKEGEYFIIDKKRSECRRKYIEELTKGMWE